MALENLEAFFVSGIENVTYLTGIAGLSITEKEAFLLLSKTENFLLAFSTTIGMYRHLSGFKPIEITPGYRLYQALNDLANRLRIKSFNFEKNNLTFAEYGSLENKLNSFLVPTENIIESCRLIKSEKEIKSIAKAAETTDRAFDFALKNIKKGISEKDLALEIEFFIRRVSQNIAFSPIVAFGKNSAIPHYVPSVKIKLHSDTPILIDIGAKNENYCADLTRMVFFGTPDDKFKKMYDTVLNANRKAIGTLTPGIMGEKIDAISRAYIEQQGYSPYQHGLGHGLGLAIHEAPFLRPGRQDVLKENMVFTIEPGIYIEDFCGIRLEDSVVLRSSGPQLLSHAPKQLTML